MGPLTIIFIVIFSATAVLTICALPGWVKIPDNYLKILFSSLILEVIACVILIAKKEMNIEDTTPKLNIEDRNWVVLNDDGQIFQLSINDSSKGMDIETFSQNIQRKTAYGLTLTKGNDGYLVKNGDSKYLGKISENYITDSLKLFNAINIDDSEFERITYTKTNNGWSIKNGKSLPKKWSLRLNINRIFDVDTTYYNELVGDFDANKRIFHTFRGSDGAHYIVRISDADLSSEGKEPYVTFMVIRTEITSEHN